MTDTGNNFQIDEASLAPIRHDMIRFASLQLRDETLAEDVVQEALLSALTNGRQFAGRSALRVCESFVRRTD